MQHDLKNNIIIMVKLYFAGKWIFPDIGKQIPIKVRWQSQGNRQLSITIWHFLTLHSREHTYVQVQNTAADEEKKADKHEANL